MKKLIMIIAVAATLATNAASFAWQVGSGRIFDGSGTTGSAGYSPSINLKAYLFDAGKYALESIVADAYSGSVDYAKSISAATTTVNSDARIDPKSFTYATESSFNTYYVVVASDKIFISESIASGIQASAEQAIDFGSPSGASKQTFTTGTYADNGAGWYAASTSPIPEPTSGLLMLLGFCGLALRRRRA